MMKFWFGGPGWGWRLWGVSYGDKWFFGLSVKQGASHDRLLAQQPAAVDGSDAQSAEIEALRAEVEVWKASFEQAAAGHATYSERAEQLAAEVAEWKRVASAQAELHDEAEARAERLAKVLQLAEEHISALTPECYRAGQRVLAAIRDALEQEERK